MDILTNPFIEKHSTLVDFAKDEMNLSTNEIRDILQEVAVKSLKIGSKVNLLSNKMVNYYSDDLSQSGENTQEDC